jgi:hypothetical protein
VQGGRAQGGHPHAGSGAEGRDQFHTLGRSRRFPGWGGAMKRERLSGGFAT